MIGHRIILYTVARNLSTFAWYKVLLSCIANAVEGRYFIRSFSLEIPISLTAVQNAYKTGILHRDLSTGNMMIVEDKKTQEWRGMLIDWEMCSLEE